MPISREHKIAELVDAFMQLKRMMHRQLIETDNCNATPAQTEILVRIMRGEHRVSDIAQDLGASPSAVTQHINQLVEQGLVAKKESTADKREQLLQVTSAGKTAIQQKKQAMQQRIAMLTAKLTDNELEQFIAISKKMLISSQENRN